MTLADVLRQFAYWQRRPPAGDLIAIIAQFVGWKPLPLPQRFRKMDLAAGSAGSVAIAARLASHEGSVAIDSEADLDALIAGFKG